MQKINKIYESKIRGLKTYPFNTNDIVKNIHLGIFGVFDTFNVKWIYYVCPFVRNKFLFFTIDLKITNDISSD